VTFNLRKRAIAPQDPGTATPEFGADQTMVDSKWESLPPGTYATKQEMVNDLGGIDDMRESMSNIKEDPDSQSDMVDQGDMVDQVEELVDQVEELTNTASKKPFNLKKKAQIEAPFGSDSFNDTPELGEAPNEFAQEQSVANPVAQPPFSKIEEMRNWLDATDNTEVHLTLSAHNGDDAKEAVESYYSATEEIAKGTEALRVFETLPDSLKQEEQEIMAQPKKLESSVDETLKKLAKKVAEATSRKAFNIKTAQHKTMDNAIMYGPGETRIDPFLHQPVSDWHIVERNKGFGLVVDDIWNIDYETIWRENIMDKYSRPYKDKDGHWVGGYLNKRFEIDSANPDTVNMALKPGELRKPILPEYGNTESRLQEARANGDVAGALDTSKPFNWKEASSKKKS